MQCDLIRETCKNTINMFRLAWIFSFFLVHASLVHGAEDYTFYQVKEKDHLAKILRDMGYRKNIFGANGWVEKIVKLNPWLDKVGLDNIPPGIYIRVPKDLTGKLNTLSTQPIRTVVKIEKGVAQPAQGKTKPHITLFEAPSDRNYLLALLETDGKNEFHKAKIPLNLKVKPGTEKTIYVLDEVNYNDLSNQASEPIPHFKSEYFAERRVKKLKGIDGRAVEKIEYKPWSLKDRYFVHLKSGIKLTTIKSDGSSFGPFNFSPSPGPGGNVRFGVGFTESISIFLQAGGTFQTYGNLDSLTFVGSSQPLYHAGAGGWIDFDDITRLEASFLYERDFFTDGDGTNVLITPVMRPMVKFRSSVRFYERFANQMFVEGGVQIGLPQATGGADLELGIGLVGALKYRIRLNESNNFDMIGSFETRSQNTTFSSDTFNTIQLALGYSWK